MGKNIKMLKCFFKVMLNNKEETKKIIPQMYVKNIYEIDYGYLKKNKLTNLIFDIDNTLLPTDDKQVPDKLKKMFKNLEQQNFTICIMSNNKEERVKPVAIALNTSYLYKSDKPNKEAFDKALNLLQSKKENTVMIGDQMMSDIKGANDYGIYSILTDPLTSINNLKTKTSRILQNIMEKHLKKKNLFITKQYYTKEEK
ncbi:MAG: YqeG family HAD IIIA-type phosphatase [Bacilli bacterium]|nr:YqeG family HAD IIIA-type phosphatase [Bacilli bacterium]